MSDLAQWLIEQITEDERVARAAAGTVWSDDDERVPAPGRWRDDDGLVVAEEPWRNVAGCTFDDYEHTRMEPADRAHIVTWQPARVLAECDAKRRIIEVHSVTDPCDAHGPDLRSIACETLQLLALPYADRPGYRDEWTVYR